MDKKDRIVAIGGLLLAFVGLTAKTAAPSAPNSPYPTIPSPMPAGPAPTPDQKTNPTPRNPQPRCPNCNQVVGHSWDMCIAKGAKSAD
jgi:hypothetical protein